jgi:hypothetical protein
LRRHGIADSLEHAFLELGSANARVADARDEGRERPLCARAEIDGLERRTPVEGGGDDAWSLGDERALVASRSRVASECSESLALPMARAERIDI